MKQGKSEKYSKAAGMSQAMDKAPSRIEAMNARQPENALTPKQEKFCENIANGMNQADAYRNSYNTENSTDQSVYEAASRLMTGSKITARIEALRADILSEVVQDITYGYQESMIELDEAIAFAAECKNAGARVAAINLKQKISGLHVEDRKNDLSPVSAMSPERVKAALAALTLLRKAQPAVEAPQAIKVPA